MSKQYRTCLHCGANLDPGERCDCKGPVQIGNQQVKVIGYRRWDEGNAYQLQLEDGRIVTAYFDDYKAALAEKQKKTPLRILNITELDLNELAEYVLTKVAS